MLKKVLSLILALSLVLGMGLMTATFAAEENTPKIPHTLLSIDASKYFKEGTNVRNGYGYLEQSEITFEDLSYGDTTRKALKILTANNTVMSVSPLRNKGDVYKTDKKYIYHFDYYVPKTYLKETSSNDTHTNNLVFNADSALKKSFEVTSVDGAIPSPEDYRYYSYYTNNSADFYSNGVPYPKYDTSSNNGKYTIKANGNSGNDFRLKLEEWGTYEMLITKADEKNLYIAPYMHTSYGNMTNGFYFFVDDVYVQELVAKDISVTKDGEAVESLSLNQASSVSLGATVKNQFDTELGFKDKNGTVMEPLKFTVTDKNGNIVSTNEFSLNEQTHNEAIYVTTAKNTVTPVYTNETTTAWTTPTYDFDLVVTGKAALGEYTVKAELQNKDIYDADKVSYEFKINVTETANIFDNPGFESGISNMTGGSGARTWENTVEKGDGTTVSPYEGNYALKLAKTAAGGYATTTDISVVPNTVYLAKGMLLKKSGTGNAGGKTYVYLDSIKDSANEKTTATTYESITNFTTSDTWQMHELVFNTDAAVKLRFGFNSAGTNTVIYADNFYISPLRMVGKIEGYDEIVKNISNEYTVSITNQLGTTTGLLGDNAPSTTLSLKENYEGVTFENGTLTVTDEATADEVVLIATLTSPLPIATVTIEKTVKIVDNYIKNAGFENGTTGMWNSSGADIAAVTEDETTEWNDAYNGTYSMKIANSTGTGYASLKNISVLPNTTYIASANLHRKYGNGGKCTWMGLEKATAVIQPGNIQAGTNNIWVNHAVVYDTGDSTEVNMVIRSYGQTALTFVDDVYLAPLKMVGTLNGDNKVIIGETATYIADITNQLGTATGITSDNTTVSYSLKDAYNGVSVDPSSGVLTVSPDAKAGKITIVANVESSLSGVKKIKLEKEVELTPFALTISDFEVSEDEENIIVSANLNGTADVAIVYALYQNEILKDCQYMTNSAEELLGLSHKFAKVDGSYKVKVFIFNAADGVTPLAYSEEYNK